MICLAPATGQDNCALGNLDEDPQNMACAIRA